MSGAHIVKWKVLKRAYKILPIGIWIGGCALSVCVFVSVLFKKLNNFWWNERILMKFLDPVHLRESIFGRGSLQGMVVDQKWPISTTSISSLSFCLTGKWHTFFETSRQGVKNWESNFEFWVRVRNIGVWIDGYKWIFSNSKNILCYATFWSEATPGFPAPRPGAPKIGYFENPIFGIE